VDGLLRFPSFSRLEGVRHGFAAADAFGAFDARRAEDLERLAEAVAPGARLVRTRQTHSARVRWVEPDAPLPDAAELAAGIDGLATGSSGLALAALGADCPMLFLADRQRRAVAVVHCGWRGVAAGIVDVALDLLAERSGCAPRTLVAAVAPGARGCCYEVGDEVLQALAAAGIPLDGAVRPYARSDGSRTRAVDLASGIAARLVARGVDPGDVELAQDCTICGGERFHSHRRAGAAAGRMAGAIALATSHAVAR
jgi:YfiH family protein